MIRISLIIILLLAGCNSFEFSPNQVFDNDSPQNLNPQNLEKLFSATSDDTVTVVFIGDSQRFYDEVSLFVKSVNSRKDIDFVILAGDISDFGLLNELNWINRDLEKLKIPYFAVVGNHDVVANGEKIFKRYFGPLDFSFVYGGYKFIFHNTNGREYTTGNVPDLPWLTSEFHDTEAEYLIGVSHVPPYDGDFDKNLEIQYRDLLSSNSNFILSLHGHQHAHTDGHPYGDGVRYMTTNAFDKRSFVIIKLINGEVHKEIINF